MPRKSIVLLSIHCMLTVMCAHAQDAADLKAIPTEQLHNVWQLSSRVFSGSQPEDEAGFAELAKLGVKTIVSVDGIQPQVELASKYGMRYVHVPIGYDGVESPAQGSLTRIARDIQGKIYVHCHHGKHRGPAAAAILCRADDQRAAAAARQILEKAGTGKEYAGLWRDVEAFQLPASGQPLPALVEKAEVESLAAAMAKIDRVFDHLKALDQNKWQALAAHPDVTAAGESLQLEELLVECTRTTTGALKMELSSSVELVKELRAALAKTDGPTASQTIKRISAKCAACHQAHRN